MLYTNKSRYFVIKDEALSARSFSLCLSLGVFIILFHSQRNLFEAITLYLIPYRSMFYEHVQCILNCVREIDGRRRLLKMKEIKKYCNIIMAVPCNTLTASLVYCTCTAIAIEQRFDLWSTE